MPGLSREPVAHQLVAEVDKAFAEFDHVLAELAKALTEAVQRFEQDANSHLVLSKKVAALSRRMSPLEGMMIDVVSRLDRLERRG